MDNEHRSCMLASNSFHIFSDIQILKLQDKMRLNDLRKYSRVDEDELFFTDFLLRVIEGKTLEDEEE